MNAKQSFLLELTQNNWRYPNDHSKSQTNRRLRNNDYENYHVTINYGRESQSNRKARSFERIKKSRDNSGGKQMKKLLKATLITLIAVFALLGASVTALAASGYVNWNGSTAYQNILITLEQITTRGKELKTERDNINRSNEQLVNQIKDKDNLINAKTQENEALKKENDKLKETSANEANKLKQAEMDMSDVDQKSKDVLNKLR